jgi:hypothetical protein
MATTTSLKYLNLIAKLQEAPAEWSMSCIWMGGRALSGCNLEQWCEVVRGKGQLSRSCKHAFKFE